MVHKNIDPQHYAQQNYRLIHDIYVLMDAADRRVLQQFDLTASQFRVLTLLAAETEWRLIDLSQAMLCVRSTVTRIIDSLEVAGLVTRVDDAADRRAQRLTITPNGLQLLDRAQVAHSQSLGQSLGLADVAAQEKLMWLLQSLRVHLSAHLAQIDAP